MVPLCALFIVEASLSLSHWGPVPVRALLLCKERDAELDPRGSAPCRHLQCAPVMDSEQTTFSDLSVPHLSDRHSDITHPRVAPWGDCGWA